MAAPAAEQGAAIEHPAGPVAREALEPLPASAEAGIRPPRSRPPQKEIAASRHKECQHRSGCCAPGELVRGLQARIDSGAQTIVGVNKYRAPRSSCPSSKWRAGLAAGAFQDLVHVNCRPAKLGHPIGTVSHTTAGSSI